MTTPPTDETYTSTYNPSDPYASPGERRDRQGLQRLGRRLGQPRLRPRTESNEERIVVNMGPQHPSTHGVLRLILELEGETVTEARCGIGYLHTGIEKTASSGRTRRASLW